MPSSSHHEDEALEKTTQTADAMDADVITRTERVCRAKLQMLNAIYFARKADAANVASSDTWQESPRSALLKPKQAREKNTPELVFTVNHPGRTPDPLNQESKSHLDAPGIIHLDLNVA